MNWLMRLQQDGDLEAARQLVMSHLRFVVHVARELLRLRCPASGRSGAGRQHRPDEGGQTLRPDGRVRLVSFAVHWIKAEIHEYVLRNWRMVKVATTKAQRKLFFNLRKSKKRLGWLNHEEVQAVAADLGVSAADVTEMEARMSNYDQAFDLVVTMKTRVASRRCTIWKTNLRSAATIENDNWDSHATRRLECGHGDPGRAQPAHHPRPLAR